VAADPRHRAADAGERRPRAARHVRAPRVAVQGRRLRRLAEPGALTAALNWYRAGRPGGKIGKISVPTLYIWSTEDAAFGSTAALDTANWVTGPYRFEMLEDVTHWAPEEAPEAVTTLLVEHLNAR
jgi:pimeloyl-ACP methyl ester carboxylesterase